MKRIEFAIDGRAAAEEEAQRMSVREWFAGAGDDVLTYDQVMAKLPPPLPRDDRGAGLRRGRRRGRRRASGGAGSRRARRASPPAGQPRRRRRAPGEGQARCPPTLCTPKGVPRARCGPSRAARAARGPRRAGGGAPRRAKPWRTRRSVHSFTARARVERPPLRAAPLAGVVLSLARPTRVAAPSPKNDLVKIEGLPVRAIGFGRAGPSTA